MSVRVCGSPMYKSKIIPSHISIALRRSKHHTAELPLRAGLICRYSHIYEACMSPALNGSSAVWHFKRGDAIEIRNGIMFNFYTELPHVIQSHAELPSVEVSY